jgi:hypothetical protein
MVDFFNNDQPETPELPEKIKLGDQEYDPSDLQDLVNLGKLGKEVEEKYNTKLDKVYPEYTKATQKVKELESQAQELTDLKEKMAKTEQGQGGFTQDQIEVARQQLSQIMGGKLMTETELESWYTSRKQRDDGVTRLVNDVDNLISDVKANGKPETSKEELLNYMNEKGITDPTSAYKLMKENELDEWKMTKLASGKRQGLHVITGSTAGGKQPSPVKTTIQNLNEMVREALGQGGEE